MRVFVTGSAGFIGFHIARRLLADGHVVAGYDGMTPYYDVALKRRRLAILEASTGFSGTVGMLEDRALLQRAMGDFAPEIVIHLAAQVGVRYSISNPDSYIDANLAGHFNLLEAARLARPRHLLLASTSSVYGDGGERAFRETDRTDFPLSLYAATKKAGEAMAHSQARLHDLPTTCFRFFTVYGPWGRPDMAIFRFVDAVSRGEPIEVYGHGNMRRDFTFVDDLVEAVIRLITVVPETGKALSPHDSISPSAPWRSVNIAGGVTIELARFIAAIEAAVGREAKRNLLPMQPGDAATTWADPSLLRDLTGFVPSTSVEAGVRAFVDWYRNQQAQ